jgi:hypothetical protein
MDTTILLRIMKVPVAVDFPNGFLGVSTAQASKVFGGVISGRLLCVHVLFILKMSVYSLIAN